MGIIYVNVQLGLTPPVLVGTKQVCMHFARAKDPGFSPMDPDPPSEKLNPDPIL